jgi:FAD-linked oxidoreductase
MTTAAPPVWRNWTGDRACRPLELVHARSVDEVAALAARAEAEGERVRAVGSGCSYTDIAHGDGYLVSVDALDGVLEVDPAARLVRVGAGMKLRSLHHALEAHGLALPCLGEIDKQTVAGAIATDTHGSGLRFGSLSAQVAALQLVTADGGVVEIDDSDPDALLAARVGLGVLGVVTAVTLRCVDAFTLRESEYGERLPSLLDRLDELAGAHDHVSVFVLPFARRVMVVERDRVADPLAPRSAAAEWVREELLQNQLFDAAGRVTGRFPSVAAPLTRALAALARPTTTVDRSHRVFTSEIRFPVISAEWALPRALAADAIDAMTELFVRERFPAAMPFLCRFGAPSEALLSPAYGRETCYLEVIAHAHAPAEPMIAATEALLDAFGGRPHWAKRFSATASRLAGLYPEWERFMSVRDRFDPTGRFTNRWAERVLGLSVDR